ncbi:helix-turn-helix domain-containing protein, partial [Sphingobacterium deserti]|uniref:Helix-turn-helix domain-containing protein n=1 Tax=Sphingobacterium deserti TaxID=1229276 RepID=A0A0B8T1J1_9SPHI
MNKQDKNCINNKIAATIRVERFRRGYSQEFMALQLHISQNAYSRIERGVTKLDIERLDAIAALLGVTIEFLLKEGKN